MTEKHDGDQRGEFPPEVHALPTQVRCGGDGDEGRITECDHQCEGNQRHHAWALRLDLGPTGGQEHATAGEEQCRTEHGRNQIAEGKFEVEAQQHLNRVTKHDGWNSETECQPELFLECGRIVVAVVVAAVTVVIVATMRTVIMRAVVMPAVTYDIVLAIGGATVVPLLSLTNQVMLLVTLALIRWAVAFPAGVVVT